MDLYEVRFGNIRDRGGITIAVRAADETKAAIIAVVDAKFAGVHKPISFVRKVPGGEINP